LEGTDTIVSTHRKSLFHSADLLIMRLGVRRQRGEQNNVFAFTSSLLCLYFLFGFLPYEESKRTEETVTLLCGL
jgi:hypothetical protein